MGEVPKQLTPFAKGNKMGVPGPRPGAAPKSEAFKVKCWDFISHEDTFLHLKGIFYGGRYGNGPRIKPMESMKAFELIAGFCADKWKASNPNQQSPYEAMDDRSIASRLIELMGQDKVKSILVDRMEVRLTDDSSISVPRETIEVKVENGG